MHTHNSSVKYGMVILKIVKQLNMSASSNFCVNYSLAFIIALGTEWFIKASTAIIWILKCFIVSKRSVDIL